MSPLNECGVCWLEGPDRFGNFDFIEHPECEEHGWEHRKDDPAGDGREAEPGERWVA